MKRAFPVLIISFFLTMIGALSKLEGWEYARVFLIAGIVFWLWGMALVFWRNRKSMPLSLGDKSD